MVKPTAALRSFGMQDQPLGPNLRRSEIHTMDGMLGLMWYGPIDSERLVVMCPGAMGGHFGPGRGMFHQLGLALAEDGICSVSVDYRRPNDLQACVLDAIATVDLAAQRGVTKVVAIGHSFGGAIAVNVGCILASATVGVCTLSTQSAGCEGAARLAPRPLLLIHGDRDEILPAYVSEVVRDLAGGHGEVVIAEGEGHLLVDNSGAVFDRVLGFVRECLDPED